MYASYTDIDAFHDSFATWLEKEISQSKGIKQEVLITVLNKYKELKIGN